MADKMNNFAFLEKYFEIAETVPKTKRLHFLEGLIEYGLTGKQPDFAGIELTAFVGCQTLIDSGKKTSAIRSENGKKGGQVSNKSKQSQANASKSKQTQTNKKEKVKLNTFSIAETLPVEESAAPKNGALSPPQEEVRGIGLKEFKVRNPGVPIPAILDRAFGGRT